MCKRICLLSLVQPELFSLVQPALLSLVQPASFSEDVFVKNDSRTRNKWRKWSKINDRTLFLDTFYFICFYSPGLFGAKF